MDIGKTVRKVTVVPLREPVRAPEPERRPPPAPTRRPVKAPERVKEPA